ncbi:hypothetical protein MKZ38_007976 [Zalerion maritima]|uniref:NADH:flavin oxidoreductase/NADH oxidase N-terminal domain-containing protein n=1 Tax=Zalerion maritima TaxID=339359 RepID=A0AAD5WNW3_9PEZI|nr:hypothetical protein MKZ38_007976 [Zalerion maritima]
MSVNKTPAARLGEPITFPVSGRTAPNRFLNAAMSESLCTWDDVDFSKRGLPTPEYISLYKAWGQGGWGQNVTGNVQIEPDHVETSGNAIIPRDAPFSGPRFEGFKAVASVAKADGGLIVAQVSHPGRQVPDTIQRHPISASDIQQPAVFFGNFAKPRAATKEDINRVIEGFAHAAEYLEKAGFDGIQLHGAHGYLIAQFLSPRTNKRTDQYGGSVTNRARLAVEIADAVHRRVSASFVVGIKINSVEFQEDGITPEDAAQLCSALEGAGFDYFELSGGNYEEFAFVHKKESTKKREAFFLDFAETIMAARKKTGKEPRVYITGGFRTVKGLADALDVVDGVGVGKSACADPAIAGKIVQGQVDTLPPTTIPEAETAAAMVCAKKQLQQIASGEAPMDLSVSDRWQAYMAPIIAAMKPKEEGNL